MLIIHCGFVARQASLFKGGLRPVGQSLKRTVCGNWLQFAFNGSVRRVTDATVQHALRVQWRVFGVFVCFDLYFVNYKSWQAEILQERAEGCIQVDLQKKIRQD